MNRHIEKIIDAANRAFLRGTGNGDFYDLHNLMQSASAENTGLRERIIGMDRTRAWESELLYESELFEISLFLVPCKSIMPIHDHPSMTVLLKTIWGTMHLQAWDWAREYPWSGLARQSADLVLNASDKPTLVLPHTRNLHCIEALEDCAFLDILSPKYSQKSPCTYYRVSEKTQVDKEIFYRITSSECKMF